MCLCGRRTRKDTRCRYFASALAAYRLHRAVGVDGIYSRTVLATRGITAGAGFAAPELRLLLLDLMQLLQKKWGPELVLKLYVDDLTLAWRARPDLLIRNLVTVVEFVIFFMKRILMMEVSRNKSNVVASTPSIAVAIS